MCTAIIINQLHDKYPLIIGFNRDESYDRQSMEPELIQAMPLAVISPKDMVSGGTWMGAAQGGWFAGLTNQDTPDNIVGIKSRGQVVENVLFAGDHRQATKYLITLDPKDYAPFNLIFGRAGAMFLCRIHHDLPIDLEIIPHGVTVITNDCTSENFYKKKIAAVKKALEGILDLSSEDEVVTRIERALMLHSKEKNAYQSVCVHDEPIKFGTVSSSAILYKLNGSIDYYHSEGHICTNSGLSLRHHLPSINPTEQLEELQNYDCDDIINGT